MINYSFLKERLKSCGILSKDLSQALGLPSSRTAEILSGKRELSPKEMKIVSDMLGIDLISLIEYSADETKPIKYLDGTSYSNQSVDYIKTVSVKVLGYVEAGVYTESETFDIDEQETLSITPSGYDPNKMFGLIVRGNSMNKKFLPDTRLICVSIDDCPTIENGKYVIAQRNRGGLYETTVKKFEIRKDGSKWLIPESTDAKFQPIEIKGSDSEEIKILAVVIGCYLSL